MSLGLLTALALAASAPEPCIGSASESQALVRRFYTTALVEKHVREGFERDVSPAFIEHKPDIASADRVGAVTFLEGLVKELPEARWELLRVTGDAELVAVHASFTPAPGAPVFAIADFFRVERCMIVEHWDVVAGPPKGSVNPLPRF
jgi:predicted SnoaL-like aldol condensation-catalyzing enzyme